MKEYIELDKLTLSELSEEAGVPIDVNLYHDSLLLARQSGLLFDCRKQGHLQGYFTLRELAKGVWFIPMFVVHPDHRNSKVFRTLFSQLKQFILVRDVSSLVSNVYRNNKLSNNFHRKLGFEVTRESERGFEYTILIDDTLRKKWQKM